MTLGAGLVIVWSEHAPCFHTLVAPLDIGRAQFPDDTAMSRRHARIDEHAGGVSTLAAYAIALEDLGSRNGTFVEERRLTWRDFVEHGTIVRLGHTVGVATCSPESYQRGIVPPNQVGPRFGHLFGADMIANLAYEAVRGTDVRLHATAIARCLRKRWADRDELLATITAAAVAAAGAGVTEVRDTDLPPAPGRGRG